MTNTTKVLLGIIGILVIVALIIFVPRMKRSDESQTEVPETPVVVGEMPAPQTPGTATPTSPKLPAGSPANGDVFALTSSKWGWEKTATKTANVLPKGTDAFVLTFGTDGHVGGTTDCNGFGANYKVNGNKISFTEMVSTQMFCEGSQEQEYTRQIAAVESYNIDSIGILTLTLKNGEGTMTFKRK